MVELRHATSPAILAPRWTGLTASLQFWCLAETCIACWAVPPQMHLAFRCPCPVCCSAESCVDGPPGRGAPGRLQAPLCALTPSQQAAAVHASAHPHPQSRCCRWRGQHGNWVWAAVQCSDACQVRCCTSAAARCWASTAVRGCLGYLPQQCMLMVYLADYLPHSCSVMAAGLRMLKRSAKQSPILAVSIPPACAIHPGSYCLWQPTADTTELPDHQPPQAPAACTESGPDAYHASVQGSSYLHGCRSAPETRHRLQQAGQGLGEQTDHSDYETHSEDEQSPESDSNEAPSAEASGAESQCATPETTPHTTPQRREQQRWALQWFAEGCRGLAAYIKPAKRTGLSPCRSGPHRGEIAAPEVPHHAVRCTWDCRNLLLALRPGLSLPIHQV